MDSVDPKRRSRKLFGARRKHETASEAEMEEHDSSEADPAEGTPTADSQVAGAGRVFGGSVDPSASGDDDSESGSDATRSTTPSPEDETDPVTAEPVAAAAEAAPGEPGRARGHRRIR